MLEKWRIIEKEFESQTESNQLLTAMTSCMRKKLVGNTLLFRYVPKLNVSIGFYDDPFKEVNLKECKKYDLVIKRRSISSGGTVLLGPDFYGYSLCFNAKTIELPMELIYQNVMFNLMNETSKVLKVPCRYKPLNDGEVWYPDEQKWRKIGLMFLGGGGGEELILGGSITFYRPRNDLLAKILTPSAEKFKDKDAKNVTERVGSLEVLLNRKIDIEARKNIYLKSFESAFGVEFIPGELIEQELQEFEILKRKYVDGDDFLYSRSERNFGEIPSHVKRGEHMIKVTNGPMLRATVLVEENVLKDILFTGTMTASPNECFIFLEDNLKGKSISNDMIRKQIGEMYSAGTKTAMLDEEDIYYVVIEAIKKARGVK